MAERPAPCPHGGWRPERLRRVPWGDGLPGRHFRIGPAQRLPLAPSLCQRCGGLSLIELRTGTLMVVTRNGEARLKDVNPTLWAEIAAARAHMKEERA